MLILVKILIFGMPTSIPDQPVEITNAQCPRCHYVIPRSLYNVHIHRCTNTPLSYHQRVERASRAVAAERIRKRQARELRGARERTQQEEKQDREWFPCHQCGYKQNIVQLDTHYRQCLNRQIPCDYCREHFPTILMQEHRQACEVRLSRMESRRNSINSRNRQSYRASTLNPLQPDDEEFSFGEDLNPQFSMRTPVREQTIRRNTRQPTRQTNSVDWQLRRGEAPTSLIRIPTVHLPLVQNIIKQHERILARWRHIALRPPNTARRNRNSNIYQNQRESSNSSSHEDYLRNLDQPTNPHPQPFTRINYSGFTQPNIRNTSLQILLAASRHDERNIGGLTSQQILQIPNISFEPTNSEEKDLCTICFCEFVAGDIIKDLKCNHMFHTDCAAQWFSRNKLCPLCKTDSSQSIKRQNPTQIPEQVQSQAHNERSQRQNDVNQREMSRVRAEWRQRWFGDMNEGEQPAEEEHPHHTAHFR